MTFFPYEKCKKTFEQKGLELDEQKLISKHFPFPYVYVKPEESVKILIDGKFYEQDICKEMLMIGTFVYLYYLKYKKYEGADKCFIRRYECNFGKINHCLRNPKLSLLGAFGIGCCNAIKQMNEIEEKLKLEKTKVVFFDDGDTNGKNVFNVTLSNFWLTSSVHFTLALSLLKNQFWNKKESILRTLDFVVDNHYEIFDNSFVKNWPLEIREDQTMDDDDFQHVGCLTFSRALEVPSRLDYFRKIYKGSFFDVTYNYLQYKEKEKVA